MGFQLVDYDTLSKFIKESITTELKSHGIEKKDLDRALILFSKKHPDRAIQCKYLLVVLECLDKSEHVDRNKDMQILNAAAYYIREQIYESYQGAVTPFFVSPERSTLFNSLTTSLNLTTDNFPDSKDLLAMYPVLYKFMQGQVYKDSNPTKGYLELDKQAFSEKKIRGYKVEDVLQDLVIKIANLRLKQIEATKVLAKDIKPHIFTLFGTKSVGCMTDPLPEALSLLECPLVR